MRSRCRRETQRPFAPPHERLRLREAVRHQQFVMVAQIGLMPLCCHHELARDDLRALVDQLVESVLEAQGRRRVNRDHGGEKQELSGGGAGEGA